MNDSTTKKREMMKCEKHNVSGVCIKCMEEIANRYEYKPINPGDQCSTNMRVVRKINTINYLIKVLATQKSVFWRHRPYPTAFIMHQPLATLVNGIRMGRFWEIERIPKQPCEPKPEHIPKFGITGVFSSDEIDADELKRVWHPWPINDKKTGDENDLD